MCAHKDGDDVPHGTFVLNPPPMILKIAGHMALWAVLYALGVALILAELLGQHLDWLSMLYVTLCAHAGYLFDRIKFRDADLDPADLLADPDRHLYLRAHTRGLRILMVLEWAMAMSIGWAITPGLGLLVFGGVLAGYLYSGWTPTTRSRLKDVHGLKAWLVSGAVVGLAIATVIGQAGGLDGGIDIAFIEQIIQEHGGWSVAGMLLIVCGDAVICDLDDSASDEEYRTRSLPVILGDRNAGLAAVVLLLTGGAAMVGAGIGSGSLEMRLVFSAMTILSGVGILRGGPMIGGRRDWIDGRMLAVVLTTVLIVG